MRLDPDAPEHALCTETMARLRVQLAEVTRERDDARAECVEFAKQRDAANIATANWASQTYAAHDRIERLRAVARLVVDHDCCDGDDAIHTRDCLAAIEALQEGDL